MLIKKENIIKLIKDSENFKINKNLKLKFNNIMNVEELFRLSNNNINSIIENWKESMKKAKNMKEYANIQELHILSYF